MSRTYITPTAFPTINKPTKLDYIKPLVNSFQEITINDIIMYHLNKNFGGVLSNSQNIYKIKCLVFDILLCFSQTDIIDIMNNVDVKFDNTTSRLHIEYNSYQNLLFLPIKKELILRELRIKKLKRLI